MRNLFYACVIGIVGLTIADSDSNKAKSDVSPVVKDDTGSSEVGTPNLGSPAVEPHELGAVYDWESCVFPVRQRAGNAIYGGTAISLGHGLLVTAAHCVEQGTTPEIEVNGEWVPAGVSRVRNQDVAYLTIGNTSLPAVETRKPEYGENAYAFGLRTQKAMCGKISDNEALALDPGEAGVDQGDSGGGVFGEDGKLLGTIRSHRQNNRRVVMFTALTPPVPYALKNSYQASSGQSPPVQKSDPSPSVTQPAPVCSGGQCYQPQTSRTPFRIFRRNR